MSIKINFFLLVLINTMIVAACKKNEPINNPITTQTNRYNISTDKAVYVPGQTVTFKLKSLPAGAHVRYRYLNDVLGDETLSAATWTWKPPATDYRGYVVEVYTKVDGQDKTQFIIAVDISSNYSKFPRNGFLSAFGLKNSGEIGFVISDLNRYHINVVQFQDWHFKHHLPMAGTAAAPAMQWKDIANRDSYLATVKGFVDASHGFNMKSIFYNLAFGALSDAASDGVPSQWNLYKDASQVNRDFHPLGAPFKSNIYLLDPSNTGWQQFIAAKNNDVYATFGFDGYQVDQLGNRGQLYDASGAPVNLEATYKPFLQAMKAAAPTKSLVMNAVNQYGAQSIAESPVDFLYTEVWSPNESFDQLATIIRDNDAMAGGTKKTVLAAYMNYDLANTPGYFNTPGVLLTNAVIFSFGGSHLELGEHMLGKEYFPNNNLQMKPELKSSMTAYYDFLTGYQNLLRDGGVFNSPVISCTNNKMTLNTWPPQIGQVSVVGKIFTNKQVLHFLNFTNAAHLNWRDTNGNQTLPATITNAVINFTTTKTASRVWTTSPDENGIARPVTFLQASNNLSFIIPSLKYWDMVVVEY